MPSNEKPSTSRTWYTDARWVAPLAVFVVAALVWAGFRLELVRWIYRDGDAIWDSRDQLSIRSVLWSPPRELSPTGPEGEAPAAPGDGKSAGNAEASRRGSIGAVSLLTAVQSSNGDYDIHVRELTRTGWTDPAPLGGAEGAVHSRYDEITPRLSPDGKILYFASNRPGGLGGFDLYASRLGPGGPERPIHLGSHINSPFDDHSPAPHPSGLLLAFATNRPLSFLMTPPAHWDDVPLDGWKAGDEEIAYALGPQENRLHGGWSDPQPLVEINSSQRDTTPAFSPGGTFLYYSSARPGGSGGLDLYRARCRLTGLESDEITRLDVRPPASVGPPVNTRLDDSHPSLFLEGFALAYRVADEKNGVEGFFESRSHEVAPELSFAAIPMEVVTAFAVRIGGMLLAGCLLLVITVFLFRYRRFLSLSLSMRCAAAAVLIHIGMFYGFYLWKVGSDIAQLGPKPVLAEVTIERTLQAKLTLEAQRMDIDLPDQTPAPVETVQPLATSAQLSTAPSTAVETRVFSVESLASLPSATDRTLAAPPPVAQADPSRLDVSGVENVPAPHYVSEATRLLPPMEPSPQTPDPQMTPSGTAASVKVETDSPRPGPVATFVETAESQPVTMEVAVQAASTQVQAPVSDPKLLPPLARPDPDVTEIAHELPLPAQTSEAEAPSIVSPAPVATEPSATTTPRLAQVRPTPTSLPVDVAMSSRPLTRWAASPAGLSRVRDDIAQATEFEEARLQPLRAAAPVPSAAATLPELASVGETSAPRESSSRSLAPRAGERHVAAMPAPAAMQSSAPLVSSVSLQQVMPRTAPSEATTVVTAASPAPLRSLPAPGSFAAPSRPAAARPLTTAEVHLPEGEGGTTPSPGAERVADVLGSAPSARRQKLAFSAPSAMPARPPRPPSPEPRISPTTAPDLTGAPLARPTRSTPAASLLELARPEPAAAQSSALAAIAAQFPERDPTKIKPDLREVRSEPSRKLLVDTMGGTPESEDAVKRGLQWLARNQSRDGRWDVDGFSSGCSDCGTPGFQTRCDVALTGLAVLCFLGQNHVPGDSESPYRHHVARGIQWLVRAQSRDGVLAGDDTKHIMYNHGIATLALSEAYILTGDERLHGPLEKAAAVIVQSQNLRTGGWRYQPSRPIRGDTSITGWQIMALTSLRNAGIGVPEAVLDLARHWLDEEVSSGRHKGVYGYTRPEEARVAMVAEGMFVRQLLGSRRTDANVEESARYVHTQTIRQNSLDNLYLIYYGTMGLYQYQGWIWERWNTRVRDYLVHAQRTRGPRAGSWDPTGPWSEAGGSILSTCFSILTLQVYYRYLPLFWQAGDAERSR